MVSTFDVLALCLALAAGGCGVDADDTATPGPGSGGEDAGIDGGEGEAAPPVDGDPGDDAPPPDAPAPPDPKPPEAPRPPVIPSWECPEGWFATPTFDEDGQADAGDLADHHHCQPPQPPAQACPAGQMRRLGEVECVAHGVECPIGRINWADESELRERAPGFDGDVLYVLPRRAVGAGERDDPFGSLDDAAHLARAGDVIALAPGEYEEPFAPEVRVALLGACVGQTLIRAPEEQHDVATLDLQAGGGGWLVADLTVTGPAPGLTFRGGPGVGEAGALVRSVRFERTKLLAINVADGPGEAVFEDIVIERTTPLDGTWGRALMAHRGGKVKARGVDVDGCRHAALGVREPGSTLEVEEAVITGTSAQPDGDGGYALAATTGGTAVLRRVWVEDGQSADFVVTSEGAIPGEPTELELEDVVIRTTRPGEGAFGGWAAYVSFGGILRGRRILVDGQGETFFSALEGTVIDLDELVIRGRTGLVAGLSTAVGAKSSLRRAVVLDTSGILLEESGPDAPFADPAGPPTRVELEDVAAFGLEADWVAHVTFGAQATLRRAHLIGGRHLAAIHGVHAGTAITLEDVAIDGVAPLAHEHQDEVQFSGLGVWATYGVALTAERFRLTDARSHGMIVGLEGMRVRLADVSIQGLGPHTDTPWKGAHGLHVQGDVDAVGERVRIGGFGGFGALAVGGRGEGTARLELTDLEIVDMAQAACREAGCDAPLGGVGLMVVGDASATVRSFAVRRSALAGVLVADGGGLAASSGRLSGNLIGLNVQDEAFEWTNALTDVLFEDNAVDVDSVVAPLPDASEALRATGL